MRKLLLLSITLLMFAFSPTFALDVGLREDVPKYGYVVPSQVDVTIPSQSQYSYEFAFKEIYYFETTQVKPVTITSFGFATYPCINSTSVEYPLITHCINNSNYIITNHNKMPIKQGVPRYTIANSKVNLCEAPTGQAIV